MIVLKIFFDIIFPVFFIIGCGVLLDRKFKLDLPTLSKLNFYIFVPALVFIKILDNEIPLKEMGMIALFSLVLAAALFLAAAVISRIRKDTSPILILGSVFFNSGNYGIPLTMLAFGEEMVPVIAIILMVQNLLNFSLGIWLLEKDKHDSKSVSGIFKVPVIYAIIIGFLIKASGWELFPQVKQPLEYIVGGLIPIALLTLGVQLARVKLGKNLLRLSQIILTRLLISPLVAWGLVTLFGFKPELAGMLIVTAGLPTAVNVYILSAEYKNDEELASRAVFWTTLLSLATIPILILLFRVT